MASSGFTSATRYVPVPSPLLGAMLKDIDDLTELKCTLRAIWLLHHHKDREQTRPLAHSALARDPVLASCAIGPAMEAAVQRGIFLRVLAGEAGQEEPAYLLNTEGNRKAMASHHGKWALADDAPPGPGPQGDQPNIFALYEDNIGVLSPMMADQLRDAEDIYPAQWIEDAIMLAVKANARNWRYVESILKRWEREGRDDGESGRHPEADRRQLFLADYLRQRDAAP